MPVASSTTTATRSPAACTAWASRWSTRCPSTCGWDIWRDGFHYQQEYALGEPQYPLKQLEASTKRGTTLRFKPSVAIFSDVEFHYDILARRLRELSFLNSGVKITLIDERGEGRRDDFHYEGGIRSFVEHLAQLKSPLHPERDLGHR